MATVPAERTITYLWARMSPGSSAAAAGNGSGVDPGVSGPPAAVWNAISRHRGHPVRGGPAGTGADDGTTGVWVSSFTDPYDAVAAALAAQGDVAGSTSSGERPGLRLALHTGAPALGAELLKLAHDGQTLVSEATAMRIQRDLPPGVSLQSLGTHQLRDLRTSLAIFQLRHPGGGGEFGPPRSLDQVPHNLPTQLTPFIGREQELHTLGDWLQAHRLVTLTGSGGVGKTRLALQVAAQNADIFADGVWLAELAALGDPDLVPAAVAKALGVAEAADEPLLATLTHVLAARHVLLVLDNCEHLVAAAAALADALLRTCPGVRILATSREALGVEGEVVWPVAPLSVPDPEQPLDLERLQQHGAVQLFVARALAVQPGFRLTAENGRDVAEVCRRLDGVPLAIELAAARVNLLTVRQLTGRLEQSLTVLAGGRRTADPRHQTLRAAVEWSYGLLAEPERILWRRLSVFAGGFTLAAAEAVAGGEGLAGSDVLAVGDVLAALGQLVAKSLLLTDASGDEARYRLLEPLRQHAAEKLVAAGEEAAVRGRHLDWCLAMASAAVAALTGADQGDWLARLEREHDNLRAALGWSLASPGDDRHQEAGPADAGAPAAARPVVQGVRLAGALVPFWDIRGHLNEGQRWLRLALERSPERNRERAQALHGVGTLLRTLSDFAQAAALHQEALAIWRELGDRPGEAAALLGVGRALLAQCEFRAALAPLVESVGLYRAMGDKWGIAWTLHYLGTLHYHMGNYAQSTALLTEGLSRLRGLADWRGVARSLLGLGVIARDQGDPERAMVLLQEGLALARATGLRTFLPHLLFHLARTALGVGDTARAALPLPEVIALADQMELANVKKWSWMLQGELALQKGDIATAQACLAKGLEACQQTPDEYWRAHIQAVLGRVARASGAAGRALTLGAEALAMRWKMGDGLSLAHSLEALAALAVDQDQAERALALYGAATGLRRALGTPLQPVDGPEYEAHLAALRARLGDAAFDQAWQQACTVTPERAVAAALSWAGRPLPAPGPESGAAAVGAAAVARAEAAVEAGAAPASESAATGPRRNRPAGLTTRELEIARLVATGLSDREVAARLHISPRTVDTHLRNIFAKAEVSSRAGLTAWVIRSGVAGDGDR